MKKISIALAIMLLAPIAIVRAETTDGNTVRAEADKPILIRMEDRINKVENKIEIRKGQIDSKVKAVMERTEEQKANIDEKASTTKARIENKIEKTEKRIEVRKEANKTKALELVLRAEKKMFAAISRIEILATRVADRLNILEDKGIIKTETKTQIETKLTEARVLLSDAKAFTAKINESANSAIASSTPKEALKETKDLAKIAEEKVKAAHAKVVDAVTMIKASLDREAKSATTTP